MVSLLPNSFPTIEDFLNKFRTTRFVLHRCGKTKTDLECIHLILSKLRGPFQFFASTFYSTMDDLGAHFTMPTFDVFCEHLSHDQCHLS